MLYLGALTSRILYYFAKASTAKGLMTGVFTQSQRYKGQTKLSLEMSVWSVLCAVDNSGSAGLCKISSPGLIC